MVEIQGRSFCIAIATPSHVVIMKCHKLGKCGVRVTNPLTTPLPHVLLTAV